MMGAATLVPPKTFQPLTPNVSNTPTPVFGSATAETSATARLAHPVLTFCHDGVGSKAEHPEPEPFHAVSVHPRLLLAVVSDVPPTDVTNCDAAGYSTPNPLSPELAVTATPGWR